MKTIVFILLSLFIYSFSNLTYAHLGENHAEEDEIRVRKITGGKAFLGKPKENLNVAENGQWSAVIPWPHVAVSAAVLRDGRILTWASNKKNAFPSKKEFTYTATWDPNTGEFSEIPHEGHDLFCGHQVILNDGRIFVNGGRNLVKTTSIFNPANNQWEIVQPMNRGRWYPTSVVLPDNRVLTMLGWGGGKYPEIWSENIGWKVLSNIDLTKSLLTHKDHFEYNWSPLLTFAPNGNILQFGPTPDMHWLSANNNGSIGSAGSARFEAYTKESAFVMYDEKHLLITGGSASKSDEKSVSDAAILTIENEDVTVTPIAPMQFARKFHNPVVLPNGEVFIVGGNTSGEKFQDDQSVLTTELWNAQSKTFRTAADSSIPRNYHSVALLMIDGRVFSAGGGLCGTCKTNHQDAQIYSPPYLFDKTGQPAVRPVILEAPERASEGQAITVRTDHPISQFALIKTSSTTHGTNTDQRFLPITFSQKSLEHYELTLPHNPNVMTPGMWMLFALNEQGVPSLAKVIQIYATTTYKANALLSSLAPSDARSNTPSIQKTPQASLKLQASVQLEKNQTLPKQAGNVVNYQLDITGFNQPTLVGRFGDQSEEQISLESTLTHTYKQPGHYKVTISATDASGKNAQTSFTQIIHSALSTRPSFSSSSIVLNPSEEVVWNVNTDQNSVTAIDTQTLKKITEIKVGKEPASLQFAPNGMLWVTNKKSATLSLIDATNLQLIKTLKLPDGSQPHGIVFDQYHAYVVLEALGQVIIINLNPLSILGRINVGAHPRHLSISEEKKKLFISRFITPPQFNEKPEEKINRRQPEPVATGGEIVVVSLENNQVEKTIFLAPNLHSDSEHSARGVPNYLGAAAISPDGLSAWIPSKQDNIFRGLARDGQPLTHDTTVRSISSHINLDTLTETAYDRIDHDNAGMPSVALHDPSGSFLFVAFESSREVELIDLQTREPLMRFAVEHAPKGMVMLKNYSKLFVLNDLSRSVTVHDTLDFFAGKTESIPLLKQINIVEKETLSAQILRGKQLFYDSSDERLSSEQYLSCAACHNEGAQDGRVWDLTHLGEGLRNTITLKGTGEGHGLLHWSANFDEVQDFEIAIRALAGGTGLMNEADYNNKETVHPFGLSKKGKSADLDALAAYVKSLTTYDVSPNKKNGTFSTVAAEGALLFKTYQCDTCHKGEAMTNSEEHKVFNVGTLLPSSGFRLNKKLTGLDVPTLHQLWNSAPYLHNGSASSIEEAIEAHQNILKPKAGEVSAIATFLKEVD